MKIFCCPAYAYVNQGKLESRSIKCNFVGYAFGVKGYKLWCLDLKTPKLIIEKNIIFNKSAMLTFKEDFTGSSSDTGTNVGTNE